MLRPAILIFVILFLMGCGGPGDPTVHQAGQRLGETVTDFAKGVGSGVDHKLEVQVELSEPVSTLGLRTTVAKANGLDPSHHKTVTVYFIANRAVKEWLRARALNSAGEEVGRSTVEVELAEDDAKYVTFAFDAEMDMQRVARYVVEIGKPVPPQPKASEPVGGDPNRDA